MLGASQRKPCGSASHTHTRGSRAFPSLQPVVDNDFLHRLFMPHNMKGPGWPARDNARCFKIVLKGEKQDIKQSEEGWLLKIDRGKNTSHDISSPDGPFNAKRAWTNTEKKLRLRKRRGDRRHDPLGGRQQIVCPELRKQSSMHQRQVIIF